ncbi:DUF3501 family protein [Holospora undulata]|uniref:Uncharacterized protein n=1 Tax=Holospora undulata HU1 TaxID=1321371 RepID=A0A061JHL6_9PROT|nr:DUF3501 family protein [Holospora undulata]ETZ04843.1 hypothetical protein K737_300743 [Holospora undulata HU1]
MIPFFESFYTPLLVQDFSFHGFKEERSLVIHKIMQFKRQRRVQLGPDFSITFEHKLLVWFQIQEMLLAENRFDGIEEEIAVYSPLIPKPNVLTITAMWEYSDPKIRYEQLKNLWNFRSYLYVSFKDEKYFSESLPEDTWISEGDRALSVNFLRFVMPKECIFPDSIHIHHPCYQADALIPESLWTAYEDIFSKND